MRIPRKKALVLLKGSACFAIVAALYFGFSIGHSKTYMCYNRNHEQVEVVFNRNWFSVDGTRSPLMAARDLTYQGVDMTIGTSENGAKWFYYVQSDGNNPVFTINYDIYRNCS